MNKILALDYNIIILAIANYYLAPSYLALSSYIGAKEKKTADITHSTAYRPANQRTTIQNLSYKTMKVCPSIFVVFFLENRCLSSFLE